MNKEIVKQGYGMAYLRYPHRLEAEFLEAELAARRAAIGMWASPRKQKRGTADKDAAFKEELRQTQQVEDTVYITRTGSKYHRTNCSYLRKSKTAITREEAIERGYEPCKRCKP